MTDPTSAHQVYFMDDDHKVTVRVSGSKTKVFISGKKAKRKVVKVDMICAFKHQGNGSRAKSIACEQYRKVLFFTPAGLSNGGFFISKHQEVKSHIFVLRRAD
jgi:hypothetical protein